MDGVLIIDKPAGMTSHDVVARVRKMIGERRIGHTGTLDPFATGVLVLLIGRATRIAQFLSNAEKEYEAVIRLGYSTNTGDITGRAVNDIAISPSPQAERGLRGEVDPALTPPPAPPRERGGGSKDEAKLSLRSLDTNEVQAAFTSLTGEIEQVPPMYSAKKIAGRKLYEHARRGEQVERQPVRVMIREFEALPLDGALLKTNEDGTTDFRVRVVCSAGTYIRTLAEDLGKKLGIGAHLVELHRTRAGHFQIDSATTLERLGKICSEDMLASVLVPSHDALSHLPIIELNDEQVRRTLHGLDLTAGHDEQLSDGDSIRLSRNGELIAIGKFDRGEGAIHPAVVLGREQ